MRSSTTPRPPVHRPSFRLEIDHLASLADTRTYRTTVNVPGIAYGGATIIAKPGDPDRSIIITRMRSTDPRSACRGSAARRSTPRATR